MKVWKEVAKRDWKLKEDAKLREQARNLRL